ncbi:hypothetical protein LAZ67_10003086 [Cordylochernes scorpioides]|uniref:Uncharacterized protein n=1 Tax=Cordylochernes scorpioides TaxID=51811 RepID=A0ABY6KX11_9ARAC|nr:hypothetical protein LAZ67_10003086 [Cordylochernes scorpioides]
MQFDNYPDATISDIRRIFELHEERNKNNKDENAAYNMGHKFNKNLKKNSSDSNRERKPKCFICQKFGHKAAVCWFNPVNKRKENNQENSIQTIPKQTFLKNKQYTSRASLIGENHNQETAMNLSSPEFNNKYKWILDSGATSHMSTDINLMDEFQDDSRKITLPDDRFIKSNGIGSVEIYKDDNNLLTLKEVQYVPELNNILISFTRLPFKEIDSKQSTKPLDLIHMDLIGPFQHESIGRAIYVLNIIDDFSRKIFPKFLKSKSETFAKLKEFIELIENIKGTKIKRIRSDNGGEFTSRQLSFYLIEKGIEHQFTTFYSPSQNGIVERANRSLIEGTRALLIESQLPPKFWAEAMNTYSYIKNRTPHKRNDKTTPEELFTGKKPTIKHLKVFGCRAEYWIPKFKRYKFEKITKSGIFVGYSNKRKAFRICDPKNYAITETKVVSFIEKEKGAELHSNEVKAELPDHVLIDLNICHKNESTSNEPDEDKNVYNLRPTPEQGFYYESSLSDEDISQDDTTSDPTYHPAESVMKVDSLPIIPTNYEEAINSPDKEKWLQAMKGEIDSLNNHKVWDVLPMTKTIKPIKSKWVFSIKNSHDPLSDSLANWEAFTKYIEDNINLIPPTPKNYSRASNLIISCAKKFIPRGHRKIYIPCWSPESERLYQEYNLSGNTETAENLIRSLDDSRKHRWHTMLEQMDFSKSSRKSWSLLRKLGGADPPHKHNQLTNPNKIATCISSKSRIHPNPSEKSRLKKVIGTNLSKSSTHPQLSTNIDLNEVEDAIKVTHNNRAPGPDGIMPEFMKHLGQKAIKWMAKLFTNILSTGSIPSVWKQAKVLAILKPGKTSDDPNNYRPISLLCIPYKILERIILNRISPIIEEYLPIEQAGFRPGRNCAEQTLALTTTIEDGFQKKLKTGAVFVDLTAAYDTVWREGLLYKLSKIINCKNIIKLINNFLTNRKITVHLNNKKSRPRTLNNGLPQGSVLAPLLFNVYTADIPATNSQKFLYADDIALLHQEQSFSTLEQILNEDLKKLENFFSKWHLIPNPSKTVSSVFHLNNHKANRPLKLTFCNKPLSHDPCPKYLGVTLDRSLTFRQHLEKTRDKLKTRNNIMTRLAGTTWGCSADTLRTTALALVYSVAEYCAPVWERSSHTDSIDAQLNQTMRLITGNMRPTPIDWLPYLSNIAPPDLRRKKSTSNLLSKIKANTKLPINTVLEIPPPTRLISRNPAWVADENVDLKEEWRNRWSNLAIANKDLVEDPNTKPPGYNLPRRTWSTLNRIRTSTGRCNYLLNKWNMSPDQNCDCGQIQTMHHILRDCPRRFFQGTLGDIHRCTEEALEWIRHLDIPL